jgi:hypothetical protein
MLRMTKAQAWAALTITLALALAACASGPPYRDVAAHVPPPTEGKGRIFLYGDTVAWKGFRLDHLWHPAVLIDGKPVLTPSGREIVFFVDAEPGTHRISVDNDVRTHDEAPPEAYPGKEITLDVRADQRYYVKLIRHGEDNVFQLGPQQHYLELKPVHEILGEIEIGRFAYRGLPPPPQG